MQDDDTLASGETEATRAPAPGGHVGKYEILRPLGAGGMGSVWAARDPDLDREVAIKLLRGERSNTELRTRLLREARAMARLKHPNVLTVYEAASDGGRDFIAMELVDGHSLDAWLQDKPSKRDVWDTVIAAGRGLAAAHAAGLIHRDFKPHNVLRSRDGRVLVTDFGLARSAFELAETEQASAADSLLDVQLTATGALIGTPAYMAPEQFGGETDARTDQFGFCVTAWEALAGARPYAGTTIEQLRAAAKSGMPARDAKLPTGVRAVLERGLAPDPANRWPDMTALLAALERTRRIWPRRLAVLAPLVLAAGAALAFVALRHGSASAPSCDPEQAFGSAWTPELRADVLARHPSLTSLLPRVDDYRALWLDGYGRACRAQTADRDAALACYGELRDELALHVDLLQRFEEGIVGERDLVDLLAVGDTCAKLRISRPPLPTDQRHDKIVAFLVKAYGALDKTDGIVGNFDGLRAEAKTIGWPPIEARVEEMIAFTTDMSSYVGLSQPAYRRAAELAHASQDRVTEARARIGILADARYELEKTAQPMLAYDSELRDAESAVHDAGDPETMRAMLDHLRAQHAAYVEGDLTKAIDLEFDALPKVQVRGDVTAMERLAPELASFLCVRSGHDDVAKATQELNLIAHNFQRSQWQKHLGWLREARYWAAWLAGDIAGAHAALDPGERFKLANASPITGHVVDARGQAVAGASIVVWQGEMYGDRERVFTDATEGDFVTSAADGSFKAMACDSCGIIAELGDQRSMPALAKDGVSLALGPTREVSGIVDAGGEPVAGIEPYARIALAPKIAWYDTIAPSTDGRFTIAGIPAAAKHVDLGALGSHWPRDRFRRIAADGTTIHWPFGDTFDVVVPDGVDNVWLLRGKVAPASTELLTKAGEAADALQARAEPVGWGNATVDGLVGYKAGSRHAVFHDIAPGPVTACIVQDTTVRCKTENAGRFQAAVRDGRHWPGGTVVPF